MKTKIILFVASLISVTVFSQKKWTLKECVNYALKNNIKIKQNKLNINVAKANVKDSKGNFLPNFNASTGGNLSFNPINRGFDRDGTSATFSGNLGFNSSITLYAGNRNKNILKQAELGVKISELDLALINSNISLNIVNTYLNVLFSKENLNVAKTQSKVSKKQVERAREQFKIGTIAKTELLNAQSNAANDLQNVVIQENNLTLALLQLAQLLQISSEDFDIASIDAVTPSVLLFSDSKEVYKKALALRPEIKKAELDIENAEIGVDIAKSGYLPSVTASANAGMNYSYGLGNSNNRANYALPRQLNNSFNYGAGFSMSIPIFSGYKTDANVERAKIQKNIRQTALENQKLQLEQTIQQAYLNARLAAKTYEVAEISLKSQKEAFKNAEASYNYGSMNQFDFNQVRSRLVNAEGVMIRAKYDFIFKSKVLKFYYGESILD